MIRQATVRDLDALVEGNLAMALETENLALDRAVLTEGVRALLEGRARGSYFVRTDEGGQIVAQLMITYEWSDWRNGEVWWIQSVYVPPAHRGHGHYRALYEAVKAEAMARGARGIRLYVDRRNVRGQAVYHALGMNGDHYLVFEAMF